MILRNMLVECNSMDKNDISSKIVVSLFHLVIDLFVFLLLTTSVNNLNILYVFVLDYL